MDAALGWLGDIIRAILRFVPVLIIVRNTHAGVKWKYGTHAIVLTHENGLWETGLHVYWPLTTEFQLVPIKRQTANLVPQYLCTRDNKAVGVGGIVVYEIADVLKLLTECYGYEDTIRDIAMATIKRVVTEHDYVFIQQNTKDLDSELTQELRKQLGRFGVRTVRFTMGDCTQIRVIGLWGAGGV